MVDAQSHDGDFKKVLRSYEKRLNSIERHRHTGTAEIEAGSRDVPNPPSFVQFDRVIVGGDPGVKSTWDEPTTNTDGSELTDFYRYEVQQQIGLTASWGDLTDVAPAKPQDSLNALFNRAGRGDGWTGGDGGASHRDLQGRDWWFWSDSTWGSVDGAGNTQKWFMLRNSLTRTVGTDTSSTVLFDGRDNMLPDVLQVKHWTVVAPNTATNVEGGVLFTPTNSGSIFLAPAYRPQLAPGDGVTFSARVDAPVKEIRLQWRTEGNQNVGDPVVVTPQEGDSIISVSGVAPEGASRPMLQLVGSGSTPVTITQVYAAKTAGSMASYRVSDPGFTFKNYAKNPDGSVTTAGSTALTEVWRNIATNPSNEGTNLPGRTMYNGATMELRDSPDAFNGTRVMRVTKGNAGNGNMTRIDTAPQTGLEPGVKAYLRCRVRGSTVDSGSLLSVGVRYYAGGAGAGAGPTQAIPLTSNWQEVTLDPGDGGSDGVTCATLFLIASGAAWSASDWVEIDAREIYVGTPPPARYFDGSTPDGAGFAYSWDGNPYTSDSVMYATQVQRRNLAINPSVPSLDGWSTKGASALVYDAGTRPGTGDGALTPAVVNDSVLDPIRDLLADPQAQVGIGVNGDSTAETTGSLTNPDLSDRWMETLQRALRRHQGSPGVLTDPVGYYGADAYVSAYFQHPGPVDWQVRGPFTGVTSMGPSGRALSLPYGSSAHLQATFSQALLEIPTWGFGRTAVVSVDGVEVARLDTFSGEQGLIRWSTGDLGYGQHLISIESSRVAGTVDGDVRVAGASLFDEASYVRGTRVFDLSCSGRALKDHIDNPQILKDNLRRKIDLQIWSLDFNDAGRGITPAQHKANLKTMLARQRSQGYEGKNLIISKWDPSASVTANWPAPMEQYRARMREVAQEEPDTAFLDLGEIIPNPDVDSSLFQDWVHQNEIGNQRIAAALAQVLTGGSTGGSVRVSSQVSGQGAAFSAFTESAFDGGGRVTMSTFVRGPKGRAVRSRIEPNGVTDSAASTGAPVTLTGGWDRVPVTGVVPAGSPAILTVVQADSEGPLQFNVADVLVEEGITTGDYFDAATPPTDRVSYRVDSDGSTVAVSPSPLNWNSPGDTTVSFDPDVEHSFAGSVKVVAASRSGTAEVSNLLVLGDELADGATIVGWLQAGPGVTEVTVQSEFWTDSTQEAVTRDHVVEVAQDRMVEFRIHEEPEGGDYSLKRVSLLASGDGSVPASFYVTELTVVAGEYTGPAFGGTSQGAHAKSVWDGPAGGNSILTLRNTNVAGNPDQHTSLLSAEAFGLQPWKFLWCQGAVGDGDTGLMFLQSFYHAPVAREDAWNFERSGDIVVARFDLNRQVLVDAYVLEEGTDVQWGEALWIEGDWLYCYGSIANGDEVMLRRYPVSSMTGRMSGQGGTWTGSAWGADDASPGPVATVPSGGGFSAVRLLDGRWVALYTAGFMDHLQSWEAAAPEGPFAPADVVWSYPHDGVNRYVPRFHPQFDRRSNGVVMSICESGNDKYAPIFLVGPPGERTASFDDAFWSESRLTEDPVFVQVPVDLDVPYQIRVRTLDTFGNASEWEVGQETLPPLEEPAVNKPSTPVASSFFRGGRVFWDGLDEYGEPYENFQHYEVHLNTQQDFDPSNWTRVDSSVLAGGVTPISVGDYGNHYVRVVVTTSAGTSEPSDPAVFTPERLSDPDLGQTLIDGARLKPGTVNSSALTVGTLTDNLLPNSAFEQESLSAPGKPSMWTSGWPHGIEPGDDWDSAGTWERSEVDPISGGASLKLTTTESTWLQVVSDPPIPVLPGDIYYVAARLRTDGIDGDVEISLVLGETEADVNGFASATSKKIVVGSTAGGQTTQVIEGPVEVPDRHGDGSGTPMRFASLAIEAKATGRSYTTWLDEVEVKRVTGEAAIADASINRAKIRYLAVDDARIASVGVGKLVAGELFADITVSARIKTSEGGRRWEANKDGAFTFNPNLTSGDDQIPVTQMRATDGGLVSRWFRTNTEGTRIEMGTYGSGASSALMSFHPAGTPWQFPPAFGFGGEFRQGSIPGLAMHAGSFSEANYHKYGMNMIAVDQVGGITMLSGNLLDGKESDEGAPVTINAGGRDGIITLLGGSYDGARLVLSPHTRFFADNPNNLPTSSLDINYGVINLVRAGSVNNYQIRWQSADEWGAWPYTGMLFEGDNTFRFATSVTSTALTITVTGIIGGSGWNGAAKIKSEGQDDTYCVLRHVAGESPSIKAYNGSTQVASKTFVIDHPVDEDKYLVHAAVEGPTADVFYRGKARVSGGSVEVTLPDYFEALTVPGTATVQATPVYEGAPVPVAPVAVSEVSRGRFHVLCEQDVAVFWEVKAQRADTPVEVEPDRADVRVEGDGPYTYLVTR